MNVNNFKWQKIIQRYTFLARLQEQPLCVKYNISSEEINKIRQINCGKLACYVSRRFGRNSFIMNDWENSQGDAYHLLKQFLNPRKALFYAKWKLFCRRIPLDYVLGWTPFLNLKISVKSPTLIPRSDTENWVSQLIEFFISKKDLLHSLNVLEVGTGTGCITIAMSKHLSKHKYTAIDICSKAIKLAQSNATANNVQSINFMQQDLQTYEPTNLYNIILSNPPYIKRSHWISHVAPSVRKWESSRALLNDGTNKQGISFYKKLLKFAVKYLEDGRQCTQFLAFEIDGTKDQLHSLIQEAKTCGFCVEKIFKDNAGRSRALLLKRDKGLE